MTQLQKTLCYTLLLFGISTQAQADGYQDLLTLFAQWRQFETPPLLEGAPDYTAAKLTYTLMGYASRCE